MMLSCKDVSAKVSGSLDQRLSLRERIGVKLHLLMCSACRRMARQMTLLRAAMRRIESGRADRGGSGDERLSKEAASRMLQRLREETRNHQ